MHNHSMQQQIHDRDWFVRWNCLILFNDKFVINVIRITPIEYGIDKNKIELLPI